MIYLFHGSIKNKNKMTEIEDFYPSIVDNYESRRKKILSNIDENILTNFVIDLSKEKFTDRNKYDKYINKLKRKYKIFI